MLEAAFGNFEVNDLVFTNTSPDQLRDGVNYKLPEGVYRICVTAYDYDKPGYTTPLSAPGTGCAVFTICYTASAPQMIQPVSTMIQNGPSAFQPFTPHSSQVNFIWTPPTTTCGTPLRALTYDLEIRQVFAGRRSRTRRIIPMCSTRLIYHLLLISWIRSGTRMCWCRVIVISPG